MHNCSKSEFVGKLTFVLSYVNYKQLEEEAFNALSSYGVGLTLTHFLHLKTILFNCGLVL